ncbi:hypothetical protein [Brevundimonas sp.]|uniref:hypothetical protein n=1 Tax=Brevundimonas sp. TaxID=1871086 RepID=UPI0035AE8758
MNGAVIGAGCEFESDAVPGRAWLPRDKDAKAAIRAREEAARAKLEPAPVEADPRVAELEAKLAEADELAKLRDDENAALKARAEAAEAALAKFDGDQDGKPGGSKPKAD